VGLVLRVKLISLHPTCFIILSRVGMTYKTGFGLDDWIYSALYIHTFRDYRQYSAVAILHTLQFTVTHALGFSVFTSRILATDLSQSHCHFTSHMQSSCHSLIPFLPFLVNHLQLSSPELDPILFRLLFYSIQATIFVPLLPLGTDPTENTVFCC
jgi:hypothetical protein